MTIAEQLQSFIRNESLDKYISVYDRNGKIEFEIDNYERKQLTKLLEYIHGINEDKHKIIVKLGIRFYRSEFNDKMYLSNCIFNENVYFEKCVFIKNIDIKNTTFKKEVGFSESIFKSKTRFHETTFCQTAYFNNTIFEDLVDFYKAKFKATQKFALTDFLGKAIFTKVIFYKQIQFIYNKVKQETMISFEDTEFRESLDISRANFWCKLQFWGATVNLEPKELWLYQFDDIEEQEVKNTEIALKRIRESFRIIKHEFRSNGNNIEALDFHKNEMIIYQKELKEREKRGDLELKNLITLWFNLFTLWFNKISNDFGTSWIRGILFTLIVTLIFYAFFLISLYNQLEFDFLSGSIKMTVKTFFQFLNITSWDFKPFGIESYNLAYIVLFIGRIFIGYGFYQTIQAFRKYGKN